MVRVGEKGNGKKKMPNDRELERLLLHPSLSWKLVFLKDLSCPCS